jgi:predicted dehydrogenase
MGRIGVGIVGCGNISATYLRNARLFAGLEMRGCADLVPELAASRAGEHGLRAMTVDELLAAPEIDLVLNLTVPAAHFEVTMAALAAGKHVFTEKPVAVDAAGVRSVIATAAQAKQKGLGVVAGTQRRHDPGYRATIARLHGGAIGEVLAGRVYWNQGGLWHAARKPEWTDAEWQIRNWLYFTWLSGDHVVEQHIHNIDVANWVLGAHPVRAAGAGGRQQRTDEKFGHVYDHFAVELEYPGGVRVLSMCRQIDGTEPLVGEFFVGTRGRAEPRGVIEGRRAWRYAAPTPAVNPYVQEHTDLVASIRAGRPLNELRQVAETTLSAIMAREAAYTGQVVTWDELLNAPLDLTPPTIAMGPLSVPPVAMPGQTKLQRSWSQA